ncbi:MAG: tetratricopeptide repeat protein [Planctomycetota bacterium]|jgi:TolA-binding protein
MTEDKIEKLLQEADRTAGLPAGVRVDLSAIRRRANRRRFASLAAPVAAAAVLMVALGIWSHTIRVPETRREQKRIVALEDQVRQLQARTDAALSLIREVLEDERRQRRLEELEAQLASIPDPLEEIQKQVDKTAFILVYQADRMYRELNQTDSAVENYLRVIELFPKNRWARVARQRLSEIENQKI